MKIRYGFVSNSSSASYIVKVDGISAYEFCERLAEEYCYTYFHRTDLVEKIEEEICASEKLLLDKTGLSFESWRQEFYGREIAHKKEILELLKGDKDEKESYFDSELEAKTLALILKEYYHIHLEEKNGKLELRGDTIMHNDFSDVPPMLKDILMYLVFDKDLAKKTECIVEHD